MRMIFRKALLVMTGALCLIVGSHVAAEDLRLNRLLASQCAQCHGTEGAAVGDMDGLAGDQDILEDLLDMVGEDHIEDIMEHQAHGYTADQMRRIAAYFASLPEADEDEEDEEKEED